MQPSDPAADDDQPPCKKKCAVLQEGGGVVTRAMQKKKVTTEEPQPSTSSDPTPAGQPASPQPSTSSDPIATRQPSSPQPSTSTDPNAEGQSLEPDLGNVNVYEHLFSSSDEDDDELLPFQPQQQEEEEEEEEEEINLDGVELESVGSDEDVFMVERPLPKHSFVIDRQPTRSFKHAGAFDEITYFVKMKNPSENVFLNSLMVEMMVLFSGILAEMRRDYPPHSRLRIFVRHPTLASPIIIYPTFINDLTVEDILYEIDRHLRSAGLIPADERLEINVAICTFKSGGAGRRKTFWTPQNVKDKKSMVQIVNKNDKWCLPRAIVVAEANLKKELFKWAGAESAQHYMKEYISMRKTTTQKQKKAALELMQMCHIPTNREGRMTDIPYYEIFLERRIIVFANTQMESQIYAGNPHFTHSLFLYYSEDEQGQGHFDTIVNLAGFLAKKQYCSKCMRAYEGIDHTCGDDICYVCKRKNCRKTQTGQMCEECNVKCRNEDCFVRHKEKRCTDQKTGQKLSLCQLNCHCPHCNINLKKRKKEHHICGESYCRVCKFYHQEKHHKCFFRSQPVFFDPGKFIFYDFECTQDSGKHIPNLVVTQTACVFCQHQEKAERCAYCGNKCEHCFKAMKKIMTEAMKAKIPKNKWPMDEWLEMHVCPDCGHRQMIFEGEYTIRRFCEWLFSHYNKNSTIIAHNAKAYDNYFIFDYLVKKMSKPPDQIIMVGCKIMYMHVGNDLNLRFLDSVNFLPMALSKIPKSFDLEALQKGYFPHLLNTLENMEKGYVCDKVPPVEYFDPDSMTEPAKEEFMKWYRKEESRLDGKKYDLREEMLKYCISDVDILRRGCLKFRQIFMKATENKKLGLAAVDPFGCITIPSACMTNFKANFLPEKWKIYLKRDCDGECSHETEDCTCVPCEGKKLTAHSKLLVNLDGTWIGSKSIEEMIQKKKFVSTSIALLPNADPLGRELYSLEALQWLKKLSDDRGIEIQTATSEAGEKRVVVTKEGKVHRFQLDGYAEVNGQKLAFEYYGCPFHGCPQCFTKERNFFVEGKKSMAQRYTETLLREKWLKEEGYVLIKKWSCEFNKEKKMYPQIWQKYVCGSNISLSDCYFGGRTNGLVLYKEFEEGEKGFYVDFTSLYPAVLKYEKFPVGHPQRINHCDEPLKKVKCSSQSCVFPHCPGFHWELPYFGILKVTILPPQNLHIPVLPVRVHDKLMFPLCYTCALRQNEEDCTCSDFERMFTQTLCSPEVDFALNMGYKIVKIHQVLHWEEFEKYNVETKKGGLFTEYINTFLKMKQEASGYPQEVTTEKEKKEYCEKYFEHEGIRLDTDKIQKNAGLRSVAKLSLNSFYGKFGQKQIKTQNLLVTELDEAFKMLSDPSIDVTDWHVLSQDVLHVEYGQRKNAQLPEMFGNVIIAALCTCWARLQLLKVMIKLDKRVLYHDTDSIIFSMKEGEYCPPLGDYLGDLTNELTCKELSCQGCEKGHWISEFVCCGPKNYAYRLNTGECTVKVRGFSLNYTNAQLVNFESMKEALFSWYKKEKLPLVTVCNLFIRDKVNLSIHSQKVEKSYGVVYDKRRVLPDYTTLPFGYKR